MKILLATQNEKKLEEFYDYFKKLNIEIITLKDLNDFDDVIETGTTFSENAVLKAKYFASKHQMYTLADDSGLSVDYLDGEPGINSKRYSGGDDFDNNDKVLFKLKGVENRSAHFTSAIALCSPTGKCEVFEGEIHGEIAVEPKGNNDFGYDPIFYLPHLNKTMAELTMDYKNQISHRANALKKVSMYVKTNFNNQWYSRWLWIFS